MTPGPARPLKKVLVAMPNWLGDLVMATVLLERLARHPDLEIHVLVRRRWLPLLEGDPRIASLISYERTGRHRRWGGTLKLARSLHGKGFSTIFVLPPSFRFGAMASFTTIPERIGFAGQGRRAMLSAAVERPPRGTLHYCEEIDLLYRRWVAQTDTEAMPSPRLAASYGDPADRSTEGLLWALAVGATYGSAKIWPAVQAAGLLKAARERGVRVLLLGDAAARDHVQDMRRLQPEGWRRPDETGPGFIDLTGRTDLLEVTRLLGAADAFVGNDSGLMHLSAALGTPTLGLFGSTNPGWTAPRGERVAVLAVEGFSCSPCHLKTCPQERFCMETLKPDAVVDVLDSWAGDLGGPSQAALQAGVWKASDSRAGRQERPTVFVDRDGVIIEDEHYLSDPANVRLIPGSAEALAELMAAGWRVICLTNQSGIGRNHYSLADFNAVQKRVDELLAEQGVVLDALYYCPHAPERRCGCRKPALGMLEAAALTAAWRPESCWMIGDKRSDVGLGEAAGLRPILVRTGYGAETATGPLPPGTIVVDDLAAAASLILAEGDS